jgi:ribosomal-protein-alanine N-acetyltransferase
MSEILIDIGNFYLKKLNASDNLDNYLYWISNPQNNEYIISSRQGYSLLELKKFIETCNSNSSILLLGIFNKSMDIHVGNIKFDNTNLKTNSATMGILIGERDYRGIGLAEKVIKSSVNWLYTNLDIKRISLGVEKNNLTAIKLYSKIGFVPENNQLQNLIRMRWDLNIE